MSMDLKSFAGRQFQGDFAPAGIAYLSITANFAGDSLFGRLFWMLDTWGRGPPACTGNFVARRRR
jgi:hypothetical protein